MVARFEDWVTRYFGTLVDDGFLSSPWHAYKIWVTHAGWHAI